MLPMLSHGFRATMPALALASVLVLATAPGARAQDTAPAPAPETTEEAAPETGAPEAAAPEPATPEPATPEAAAPEAADEDPVLAVVNGTELRRSDVVASARDLPQQYQDQLDQIFPALVERLVDLTLLQQEGERRNLQADPEVQERVAVYEDQVVRETLLQREVSAKMTDEAIQARYDDFLKEQQPQQEIHARHILVATEEEAKAVIAELDAGGDFEALAAAKSTDTGSGANGGDLGFFTPDQMVPEFSGAAVAMEPGTYSKTPVQSRFGWHVIKVEEKRDVAPPTLEEARPEIESRLQQELIGELVSDLRANAQIEMATPPAAAEPPADAAPPAAEEAPPADSGEDTPPADSSEETPPVE
jgi:peptidyl-prolyl cis-trans isomerase C